MLKSRILCNDQIQALSHQSFSIRLNVRRRRAKWLPLTQDLDCWNNNHHHNHKKNKKNHNIYSCWWNSALRWPWMSWSSRRTTSFRHHASSSLLNHPGALSVQYAGYQCCRGWNIYLLFFSRGHLILCVVDVAQIHCDNLPMKWCWSQASCVASSVGSGHVVLYEMDALQEAKNRRCKIIHQ